MQDNLNQQPGTAQDAIHSSYLAGRVAGSVESSDVPAQAEPVETSFGRIVGASAAMRRLYPLCRRLADSDLPLIIGGETGTGKELLAESLHEQGKRRAGPFVVLDCTSIPSSLVESALFGHEKGAFTGATEARRGVFEEADGGTLLLDEIGDLDFELQAKLLRALERSEITRVGSTRRIKVNVRFMAATRRDLLQMVKQGKFRDDLYYRLAVTRIDLPALRDRPGDLSRLAQTFWQRMQGEDAQPPASLLAAFERYEWPGNVRELHNAVARCVALGELAWKEEAAARARAAAPESPASTSTSTSTSTEAPGLGGVLDAGDSGMFEEILDLELPLPTARRRILAEFERMYIDRALKRSQGNVTRAASASGVGSRYFRLIRARCAKRNAA